MRLLGKGCASPSSRSSTKVGGRRSEGEERREERRWDASAIEDTRREEGMVRRIPFPSVVLGRERGVATFRSIDDFHQEEDARHVVLDGDGGPWHRHLPSPMARASRVHGRTRHTVARIGTFLFTQREGLTTQTNAIVPIVAEERSDEEHHSSSVTGNVFFVLFFPFPAEDSFSFPGPSSSPRVPFALRRGRAGVRLESHRPGPISPSKGTVSVSVRD